MPPSSIGSRAHRGGESPSGAGAPSGRGAHASGVPLPQYSSSEVEQIAQEVLAGAVEQSGALPLQEVTRALDDEGTDQLAEGHFAHLGELSVEDVVVRSVQRERRHRADLE